MRSKIEGLTFNNGSQIKLLHRSVESLNLFGRFSSKILEYCLHGLTKISLACFNFADSLWTQ